MDALIILVVDMFCFSVPGCSMSEKNTPVIWIIGNGVTGITAARNIRKEFSAAIIRIVSDETDYFFSRTALMYIYMGHMRAVDTEPYERSFYAKNRLELYRDRVMEIDAKKKTLSFQSGRSESYDYLLIATGSLPGKAGWPGQDLEGVHGMYSMQDLETLEKRTPEIKQAVVVGGGLIGVELAEMLHSRRIPVTFLVREEHFYNKILPPEESLMIEREITAHGIDLRLATELQEIEGENGTVRRIKTTDGTTIETDFVGLCIGVTPNKSLKSSVATARGYLIDEYFRTSEPDIFAAGDCAQFQSDGQPGRIEQLWYTGRMQGEAVGKILGQLSREAGKADPVAVDTGKKQQIIEQCLPYTKGIFFNSAKFFTVEYQVYGDVPSAPKPEQTILWKHPKKNKSIRLCFEEKDGRKVITGFNLMGIRYRQQVCEQWIAEKADLPRLANELHKANFDPEFFPRYEKEVGKLIKRVI